MFKTFRNALKVKEIRTRLLFTLGMLIIVRLGSQIPTPGVNSQVFASWFAQQTASTGGLSMSWTVCRRNVRSRMRVHGYPRI